MHLNDSIFSPKSFCSSDYHKKVLDQMTAKSVLIVEDDQMIMNTLEKFFTFLKCTVYTASDGKEALDLFQSHDVDVVISDLNMPVMKGDALYAEMKEIEPNVVFFLLTGYTSHTSIGILKDMGITGVIEKPIELNQIRELLKEYLEA